MINTLAKYIVSLGGVGFLRPFSGTWGTLATMPVAYLLAYNFSPSSLIIFSIPIFLIGWYFTAIYEKHSDKHDASEVVIDEMAGTFVTLAFIPVDLIYYTIAFFMFRAFDIIKPYPIGAIDRQKTPFSVMFDDMVAGLFAGLVMWVIVWQTI